MLVHCYYTSIYMHIAYNIAKFTRNWTKLKAIKWPNDDTNYLIVLDEYCSIYSYLLQTPDIIFCAWACILKVDLYRLLPYGLSFYGHKANQFICWHCQSKPAKYMHIRYRTIIGIGCIMKMLRIKILTKPTLNYIYTITIH